jgi:hypothetical protein
MDNKNYYMEENIGDSGIAFTRNPSRSYQDYEPFKVKSRNINVGDIVTPSSKYDETLGNLDAIRYGETTVDDRRAEQQSGWEMAGNALANNLVIAGTTAISGTLGLVEGIFSALGEGDAQKLWDNNTNNWATELQEKTREALPIYRGKEYEDKTLLQKMGSGIFWADLVQNLGYAEGMLLPGMGMSKVLSSAPAIVRGLVPSLTSSLGEASIEAIHSKNDELANKTRIANEEYNRMAKNAESPFALGVLDSEYKKTLNAIQEDANTAGNFVFGSNVALLTMSNAIQFGNLFSKGFGTAKRLKGALKRTGNTYSTDNLGLSLLGTGVKKVVDATSEGAEEVAQSVISATPSNYNDYNTFNKSMFNPEKRELVANIWQSIGESYSKALKDPNTGVEFATGFLIGALGVPTIKKGKIPIGIENNFGVELYDKYKEVKRQQELADKINERLQDDKKVNSYYNGLVRHLSIQDRMNAALDSEDMFDYKNAESAQFISDIMMFDEAGDIDNLKTIIDNSIDLSDEGIQAIIKETSKDGEGPFMSNSNPLPIEDVRYSIEEKVGVLKDKINNYIKDKAQLESTYPNMDKETLNNAIFLKSQFRDHYLRYNDLLGKTYSGVKELFNSLPKDEKSEKEGNPMDSIPQERFSSLIQQPLFKAVIDSALNNDSSSMSYDERQSLKSNIEDVVKLGSSLVDLNKSLKEILTNPTKSAKDLEKTKEEVVNKDVEEKSSNLKTKLSSVKDLTSFREALNSDTSDVTIKSSTIDALIKDGNKLAENYNEIEAYNRDVQKAITSLKDSSEAKELALKILKSQYDNAETIQDIANPNSVYIDDAQSFFDDSKTEEENTKNFLEAQYVLWKAMNQVNNDNKFKDRFSAEYKELKQKGVPNPKAPKKEVTGSDGTPTVPGKNGKSTPPNTYVPAVGDIDSSDVIDENKSLNDDTSDERNNSKEVKKYYRPAIPELHIQASKEGDFRPFNEVVAEREKGMNFDIIYKYLKDAGAFDYVNEGNLKPGTELGFMIDPEFEESVKDEPWHTKPTVFIIDKSNGQIVGSLDESDYSVDRYEGLKSLEEKIRQEYSSRGGITNIEDVLYITRTVDGYTPLTKLQEWSKKVGDVRTNPDGVGTYNGLTYYKIEAGYRGGDNFTIWFRNTPSKRVLSKVEELLKAAKEDKYNLTEVGNLILEEINKENAIAKFIASPTTKVSKIMIGKIPYDIKERNLADIPNISSEGKLPVFGIIKNGVLSTNDKLKSDETISPKDISNKEGRLYIMIPNAAGTYSPAAVRVKHFNSQEFNPDDVAVQNTKRYKSIMEAINKLAEADNEGFVREAMQDLSKVLYIGNLHVDWVSSEKGSGIRFVQTVRGADGKEIYDTINGNRVRRENKKTVFLTEKWDPNTLVSFTSDTETVIGPEARNTEDIAKEILNVLLSFNLPLQVNLGTLNTPSENKELLESNILTSNISTAKVIDNWFTTDYFDLEGNLQKAVNPKSKYNVVKQDSTPVGGKESVFEGYPITIKSKDSEKVIYVDIKINTITDENGNKRTATAKDQLLLDVAWAYETFGNVRESSKMIDHKVLLPSGRVLNLDNYKYLSEEEAKVIKDKLQGKSSPEDSTEDIVFKLAESMSKIDMDKTDDTYYYIQEGDGSTHKYTRISSVLGENFAPSKIQEVYIKDAQTKLSQLSDNPAEYNTYLSEVGKHFNIDLSAYNNKTSVKDRLAIIEAIRNKMTHNYQSVNKVIKDFFTDPDNLNRPSNMAEDAYTKLIDTLNNIKSNIDNAGETIIGSDIVLYHKYNDGRRYAENVDLVTLDSKGNVKFYTIGVNDYSFHDFTSSKGSTVNYFKNKSTTQKESSESYITKQLSIAKNLFESHFNGKVSTLGVMPFKLDFNKSLIISVTSEKGIPIKYNPAVIVPTEATPAQAATTPEVSGARASIATERALNSFDDEFEEELRLRESTDSKITVWNKEKELSWLNKVLPQLSQEDRVKVVNGLIKVANKGTVAWGMLDNGIVTLSDIAAEGTTYHEAFHVVFNLLLDSKEKQSLLDEARKIYGEKDNISLEEDMAEGFREYVMSRDSRGLGRRILDFFKELLAKITNWKYLKPNLYSYYRMINEGKYTKESLRSSSTTNLREEEYSQEMQSIKDQAIVNGTFMKAPNGKPTNLTERQWLQVRTKAFKEWFGDWEKDPKNASKVVDENGEPLVVYHGSPKNDIQVFDASKSDRKAIGTLTSEMSGKMNFFTDDDFTVQPYAEYEKEGKYQFGKIYDVFLNIRNPKILNYNGRNWNGEGFKAEYYDLLEDAWMPLKMGEGLEFFPTEQDAIKAARKEVIGVIDDGNFRYVRDNEFQVTNLEVEKAIEEGYDGVIIKNVAEVGQGSPHGSLLSNDYVTTDTPNQIKSATDNIGTFSRDNNDIRYRKIPNTSFETIDSNIKELLMKKGWTKEKFDSISQQERDKAIECISL